MNHCCAFQGAHARKTEGAITAGDLGICSSTSQVDTATTHMVHRTLWTDEMLISRYISRYMSFLQGRQYFIIAFVLNFQGLLSCFQ